MSAVPGHLPETDQLGHDEPHGERESVERPDRHVQGTARTGRGVVPLERDEVRRQGGKWRAADHVRVWPLGFGELVVVVDGLFCCFRERHPIGVQRHE